MKIERLSIGQMAKAGLDRSDAKGIHVVSETAINQAVRPTRYNIRQADGSIKKYTVDSTGVMISTLRKIANQGYKMIERIIIK